ncbi:MAG: alpha-hydroxy-acid oxidizing protein [Aliihoeflea sp.]
MGYANVEDMRQRARRRLPRAVFDYVDGGAGDERGVQRNRDAIEQRLLKLKPLTDVSRRDLTVPLFDKRLPLPFIIGPTGLNGAIMPGGDVALARAAARFGIPFVLSTASSMSIEEVADAADGELWFQLYVLNRDAGRQFTARALNAGYRTLLLTVDVPVGGRRDRDYRNGFGVPFHMTARFALDCARRPAWALRQLRGGAPQMANLRSSAAQDANSQAMLMLRQMDASFDWDDLKALRNEWPHRLIVKGLTDPADCARCYSLGVDGVVLSNHGGRQLEDVVSGFDVIEHVDVPDGKALMVDGGFRRGADIVKALALGADAVMLGRATLYGLAAAGQAGVEQVIETLSAEIDNTLALVGCPNAADLDRTILQG